MGAEAYVDIGQSAGLEVRTLLLTSLLEERANWFVGGSMVRDPHERPTATASTRQTACVRGP